MCYVRVLDDELDTEHDQQTAEKHTGKCQYKGLSELFFEDVPVSVEATLENQDRQEDHQDAVGVDLADGLDGLPEVAQVRAEFAEQDARDEQHGRVRDLGHGAKVRQFFCLPISACRRKVAHRIGTGLSAKLWEPRARRVARSGPTTDRSARFSCRSSG